MDQLRLKGTSVGTPCSIEMLSQMSLNLKTETIRSMFILWDFRTFITEKSDMGILGEFPEIPIPAATLNLPVGLAIRYTKTAQNVMSHNL